MPKIAPLRAAIWLSAVIVGVPATFAQDDPPARPPDSGRLDRLEKRVGQLEDSIKAKDQEISQLKTQMKQQGAPAAADDIQKTTDDVLKDIQSHDTPAVTLRIPASFNPNFAVVSDFLGSYSTNQANPARNRFDIREVELDLRAAVDPRADAVVILPISRDVEDPLFFNRATASGDISTAFDVEEAYLFLHDFGVPNLTAKLGRFHLRFGRENILHKHDWPTSDNNFVNQSFLGRESLNDSGVSVSYVVPPRLIGGNYVEGIVEVISGEGDPGNAVLNNNSFVSSPGVNTHLLWNHDIARDWNVEAGGSYLLGHHNNDSHQWANVFGTDLTLIHTDPTGRFNNQMLQAEAIYGDVDSGRHNTQHSFGAYVLGQQQINRDWYIGCRLDWTKEAVDEHKEVWGVSPYITWYWSEFLRFRAEYQHKAGDTPREDTIYMQCTFIFGAHPPHPYWAMR